MKNAGYSGSRSPERGGRAENGGIRSEGEVDYLELSVEAAERVKELTSPELSRTLHLNGAQCRLLADALSEAVGSVKQDTHSLDCASVRLCGPALRELCRVAGDCEKLVRDCCKENWVAVAILLANSKEDFLLRVSEVKWCTRALRTVMQHGLQGGAWLEQFHKSSQASVADRRTDMAEDTARLKSAAEEDLKSLVAKLEEIRGNVDVGKEVGDVAGYVLRRCEMLAVQPDEEQQRNEYELRRSGTGSIRQEWLGIGGFGGVFKSSWVGEDFASKVFESGEFVLVREVAAMIKIGSHPRIIRLLGVDLESDSGSIVMELMATDLQKYMEGSMRLGERRSSTGDGPFPLHVAVDVMLQVAEGVEVLHKHGLFHRDLKPANVLVQPVEMQALREEGYVRVKLADFGLTEARSSTFRKGIVGTQDWMAPELRAALNAQSNDTLVFGAKADAFSFAVVCFEVLSGKTPFLDMLYPDMLYHDCMHHLVEGRRPELPATWPSRLASLVQRCWDKEPTKRPTFTSICKELRYLKFLITVGGEMQFRALGGPDEDAETTAKIVKHLRWIDHHELQFIRHVGSGGYGSVDECALRGKGRVAVKNLLRCSSKKRVEEEAALLVRVKHRNVVKLIGCAFNEEERKGMIVMELMDQDLHHLISKLRVRSPREPLFSLCGALEIMLKVATAMKHIRNCNVLHRDLKTTNILVNVRMVSPSSLFQRVMAWVRSSSEGACYDVKLADFGLSKYKLQDSMFTTRASEARHWQAPEASEARNYSWPADVFSFGVVCYEILSGEVPFKGVHGDELLRLVRGGKRPKIPTHCPTTVAELVDACWATDPKDRPEFEEICRKLEAFSKSKDELI